MYQVLLNLVFAIKFVKTGVARLSLFFCSKRLFRCGKQHSLLVALSLTAFAALLTLCWLPFSYIRDAEARIGELERMIYGDEEVIKMQEDLTPTRNNYQLAMVLQKQADDIDRKIRSQNSTCKPKTKLVFAKTHKSGGCTLQNIILRFTVYNNLTFAIPDTPDFKWYFNLSLKFKAEEALDAIWADKIDIFAVHSVFDYKEVKKVIPSGTYVTLLRDPVDAFESFYNFMGIFRRYQGLDINGFADMLRDSYFHHESGKYPETQSIDLGMPAEMSKNLKAMEQLTKKLTQQMDLVLITERFEESLILMQDLMCWKTFDMLYIKHNVRHKKYRSVLTTESRMVLRKWLTAEYHMYNKFTVILEEKISKFGRDEMDQRLKDFSLLNANLSEACLHSAVPRLQIDRRREESFGSDKVLGLVPNDYQEWCRPFVRSETEFILRIKRLQKHRAATTALKREELKVRLAKGIVTVVQQGCPWAGAIFMLVVLLSFWRRWRRRTAKARATQIA